MRHFKKVEEEVYSKIPITTVATNLKKEVLAKWQRQWETTEKGALCRLFFPTVEQRPKLRIPITLEFTGIVSDNGKIKSYLHRFRLIDNPMCPCSEGPGADHDRAEPEYRYLDRYATANIDYV
jgi:hypothetical protein